MILAEAKERAEELVRLLSPVTARIEIAGSVRRGKLADIKDIEIVCIPKFSPATEMTPLGVELPVAPANMLDLYILHTLDVPGGFERGDPDKAGKRAPLGQRYYRVRYKGVKVDIFAVLKPAQWGAVFAIRTGDKDFSHWLVQQGYRHGIHEIKGHLALVTDNYGKGPIVTTPFDHDKVPIPYFVVDLHTPEEKDVFAALGVPWMEPEDRVGPHITTAKEWEAATA